MSMIDLRLAVWPGTGAVLRAGGTVLVARGEPAGVAELVELCRARHGAELARAVAQAVLGGDPERLPAFAVVTEGPRGLIAMCRGDVEVLAEAGGDTVRLAGSTAVTWTEGVLGEPVRRVRIGPAGRAPAPAPAWYDLRAGVVPGEGATLVAAETPPEQDEAAGGPAEAGAAAADAPAAIGARETSGSGGTPAPPAPAPAPAPAPPGGEFHAVLLGPDPAALEGRRPLSAGPAPEPEPAGIRPAIVPGVRCSRNHHNNPAALYCSSCGIKMGVHRTLVVVDGPRPPLGVLVLDDGATVPVQHDMVIGRDPSIAGVVQSGEALGIRVEDPTNSVSRAHLHVVLQGWDVLVADHGSSNGTVVRRGEGHPWRLLQPGERVPVVTGSQIRMGDRTLVFDQHHVR